MRDYTFLGDGLDLQMSAEKNEKLDVKKSSKPEYRLRDNSRSSNLEKSKISGGHSMQGHSPVYE